MNKKILVAYASKYGATAEIAEKIGEVIEEKGLDVDVYPVNRVKDVAPYDVVILGSAVYIGAWRRPAASFLKKNVGALTGKKVWLLSSGPTGKGSVEDQLEGWTFPRGLKETGERIHFEEHTIFHGALLENKLSGMERWMIKKVKAPFEDARDWEDIKKWARSIATEIKSE